MAYLSLRAMYESSQVLCKIRYEVLLLQERRAAKQERRRRMAEEVVEFCMDVAVLTIDYKNKSGDS